MIINYEPDILRDGDLIFLGVYADVYYDSEQKDHVIDVEFVGSGTSIGHKCELIKSEIDSLIGGKMVFRDYNTIGELMRMICCEHGATLAFFTVDYSTMEGGIVKGPKSPKRLEKVTIDPVHMIVSIDIASCPLTYSNDDVHELTSFISDKIASNFPGSLEDYDTLKRYVKFLFKEIGTTVDVVKIKFI